MDESNEKIMRRKKEVPENILNANNHFFLRDYP